jgi:death-on-curing family protein
VNAVELYKTSEGETEIEVRFDKETVWLTLNQLSELYGRDKSVISRHLNNIFKNGELNYNATVAKNATVQTEGKRRVEREIEYFNLDAIISVGYRVNSKQGTQFRIWATKRLKEYLIQGYSVNQKRLEELGRILHIIENTNQKEPEGRIDETKGLLNILMKYAKSFVLLNKYDNNSLDLLSLKDHITYEIEYKEAKSAIERLKRELIKQKEASTLFGNQKDQSFAGILKSITQTFDGKYLYPTIEEQAANLLYFIIKSHPFSDGNKRIGAFLFVWFLEKNTHLLKPSGEHKINDNALAALALLVAQSDPDDKELMIKLICNLIN